MLQVRHIFSVLISETRQGKEHTGGTSNTEDAGTFKFLDVWSDQVSRQYVAHLSNSSEAKHYVLSSFFLSCISFVYSLDLFSIYFFFFPYLCYLSFVSLLHISLLDDSAGIPVVQKIFLKIMLYILRCVEWNCRAGGRT